MNENKPEGEDHKVLPIVLWCTVWTLIGVYLSVAAYGECRKAGNPISTCLIRNK